MHILMVTDFFHPLLGGVEQHVRTLSHELCRLGHDVTVATLTVDGLAERDRDGDVRIIRLGTTARRMSALFAQSRAWAPPIPDPEAFRALRRVIAEVEPDVIHGHDWLARSLLPLANSAPPLVSSLHYYTRSCARKDLLEAGRQCSGPAAVKCARCSIEHYGRVKGPVIAGATTIGRRLEDRAVSATIAVSRATAIGNGLDPDDPRVRIIPNFLSARQAIGSGEQQVDDSRQDDVDALLAHLPTGPFALYVGDFRAVKGFDLLLDAYRSSAMVAPDAPVGAPAKMPLVVIGKRWPETPTEVPTGVLLFEEWPNVAVRAAFERAAFAVVPSMWAEPFGIVAIEALAGATPVVAADVGGLSDIVADVDRSAPGIATGMLVERGSTTALSSAMDRLAGDVELRASLGAAAAVAARRYDASVVVPAIIELYESVMR